MNISETITRNLHRRGNQIALADSERTMSAASALEHIHWCAEQLLSRGISTGDRVAVHSTTSIEHTLWDVAILAVGAVPVPIYETDSSEQIAWIFQDCAPVGLLHDPGLHVGAEVAARFPGMWTSSSGLGGKLDVMPEAVAERLAGTTQDSIAGIIYTSGTTGRSKGCMLTHGNLQAALDNAVAGIPEIFDAEGRTLLFLPLAHVFARTVQYGCLANGVAIHYTTTERLGEAVKEVRPTWMVVVPRVLEKVYAGARGKSTGLKLRIFDLAVAHARSGRPRTGLPGSVYEKLVFSRIREALGGELRMVISGGAALDPELERFFTGIGVEVLEGYGLTESSAAHTANTRTAKRSGTVGRALGSSTVSVDGDGEILLGGRNVFPGYWNNPEATAEAFKDGLLRTGDLGEIDAEGFLRITGRRKEIIVTAGGKNVQPAGLEEIVARHEAVSQCVVVGDGRPFIAALIALDPIWWERAAAESTGDEAGLESRIREAVQSAVDAANVTVSRAESIRAWRLLPEEMSVLNGELTATLKTRRKVVAENHAMLIEDIYRND